MNKPRIFLGSSGKQANLLPALEKGLETVAHVESWTAVFNPGDFTTRADTPPKVNARTSGVYLRADPDDVSVMNGRDDQKRVELIAERLMNWKSIRSA